MKQRLEVLLGPMTAALPFVGTFHALGLSLLREFHEDAGLPEDFRSWIRTSGPGC